MVTRVGKGCVVENVYTGQDCVRVRLFVCLLMYASGI